MEFGKCHGNNCREALPSIDVKESTEESLHVEKDRSDAGGFCLPDDKLGLLKGEILHEELGEESVGLCRHYIPKMKIDNVRWQIDLANNARQLSCARGKTYGLEQNVSSCAEYGYFKCAPSEICSKLVEVFNGMLTFNPFSLLLWILKNNNCFMSEKFQKL